MKAVLFARELIEGRVSIPLPGFIVMKVSRSLPRPHRGDVSIPLPGFIVMKAEELRDRFQKARVSIPLPGFIVMKASLFAAKESQKVCFNPVAGIHCNESGDRIYS